jgi:hypothetical protein
MTDLQPAPVPELSEEWLDSRRTVLVEALSRTRPKPVRWMALASATAAAAAAVSILVLVGGREGGTPGRPGPAPDQAPVQAPVQSIQYAFAGWSPSPTTPAHGQVSVANSTCLARLAQLRPSNKGTGAASLLPRLSDVRGPYTVTLLGNDSRYAALCVSAPGSTSLRWITRSAASVAGDAITVDQVSILARGGQPYTLVEGQTGYGVTRVVLALGDGSKVAATSGSGVFLAWWPGSQDIRSAAITTSAGESTQYLGLAGRDIRSPTKSPPPSRGGRQPVRGGQAGTAHAGQD